jgi:ammonia channel protein AmtB
MKIVDWFGRRTGRLWGTAAVTATLMVCSFGTDTTRAQEPTTAPAAAPVTAAPDPIGFNGGPTEPLFNPNSYLTGWPTGAADKNLDAVSGGTFKAYAGDVPTPQELSKNTAKLYYSLNMVWVLVAGFLVIFMQAGFALVETGLCRAKNAAHTMSMNFAVYALGMFGFFVTGFALMCSGYNGTMIGGPGMLGGLPTMNHMFTVGAPVAGDSGWGLFGTAGFCLTGDAYDGAVVVMFLYMMAFMDTTATIVTGACAERWSYKSFFIYSIFIGGFIYPIFACWVWGGGWLAQLGYRTQTWLRASSARSRGCRLRRLGRRPPPGWGTGDHHVASDRAAYRQVRPERQGQRDPAHHVPMVQLGTFILAFGWFGFNAGSSLAGTDGRIGMVAVNTMLAGMSATLTGILYMWMTTGKPDPSMMCNSMLAGLVAITAPCAFVSPVGAFIIGAIAGVLVVSAFTSSTRSRLTIRWARAVSTASAARSASFASGSSPTGPTATAGTTLAITTSKASWPWRHRLVLRRWRRAVVGPNYRSRRLRRLEHDHRWHHLQGHRPRRRQPRAARSRDRGLGRPRNGCVRLPRIHHHRYPREHLGRPDQGGQVRTGHRLTARRLKPAIGGLTALRSLSRKSE